MKIAICGHGRHGKETASKYLSEQLGLKYSDCTSLFAAKMVFEKLAPTYHYNSPNECWLDRSNHRAEWYDIIKDYNKPDGLSLHRDMAAENDIIDGIRDRTEIAAAIKAGICDTSLWIDASKRMPPEPQASCTIGPEDCEFIIDNNGTLDDLHRNLDRWIENLMQGQAVPATPTSTNEP